MNAIPATVKLEHICCPNGCPPSDSVMITSRDRLHNLPGEFTICRCQTCGLERTNPRPTPDTIGFYYPDTYAPYNAQGVTQRFSDSKVRRIIFEWLGLENRQLPAITPGRMLEFGCASGSYMELARQQGWEVEGIEFSYGAAVQARNKGFNVHIGAIESAMPPAKKYDVVVGWMVLEHLHEPVAVLRQIRSWIQPDGYLVISVPDANSFTRTLFKEYCYDLQLPTHLFHFSKKSLEQMLKISGWKMERVFWQRNCSTLLWSMQYWSEARNYKSFFAFVVWLRTSHRARHLRMTLNILLGMTRQSARMEVWARPV